MENRIVALYKVVAYFAILWAACQPGPSEENFSWRASYDIQLCETSVIAAAAATPLR
ncbi:hypothetical protein [Methylocystis sp. S23]